MKITPLRIVAAKPTGPVLSRTQMQKELARQAAMEKELARYIALDCGHMTTLETQQRYALWRRKGKAMCEACEDWVTITRPRARTPVPEEPLF